MNKELTVEEAENIVDKMYQDRWKVVEQEPNHIDMSKLDEVKYNEFESASILLLREEMRLQRENKNLQQQIDKAIEYIENDWYKLNTRDINSIVISGDKNKLLNVRKILKGENND